MEHTTAKLYSCGAEVTDCKAVAGQLLCVAIQTNDELGNPTKLHAGESFSVQALGAVEKQFSVSRVRSLAHARFASKGDPVYPDISHHSGIQGLHGRLPSDFLDAKSKRMRWVQAPLKGVPESALVYAATMSLAGAYALNVTYLPKGAVEVGSPVNGWPQMVTVRASRVECVHKMRHKAHYGCSIKTAARFWMCCPLKAQREREQNGIA